MIDDAQRIFNYLPREYKTQIESDYVAFLWDSFSVNYEKEKYQFAYIAYHMLFMCFVYFQLAKIYLNKPNEIKNMMVFTGQVMQEVEKHETKVKEALAKNKKPPHFDPFVLALENERSILGLFIFIGCDRNIIMKMKGLIDKRNNIAHSNGSISFTNQQNLDEKIEEMLECIDCIRENTKSIIANCAEKFLLESAIPDEREFPDDENQVREIFVRGNYLSLLDIASARHYDVNKLQTNPNYDSIDRLHKMLSVIYPEVEDLE